MNASVGTSTVKYIPATIFRDPGSLDYYKTIREKVCNHSLEGKRVCEVLDSDKLSEGKIRSMNRYIAKNYFIYILGSMSRGDVLSEAHTLVIRNFLFKYGGTKYGKEYYPDTIAISN